LQSAGERGQVLLAEQAQLEARLADCESMLAQGQSQAALPEEQLPTTIPGHQGELHLPKSTCGKRIFRQILQKQADVNRIGQQVVSLEKEAEQFQKAVAQHKKITSNEKLSGWDTVLGWKEKSHGHWRTIQDKGVSWFANMGKVDEQCWHSLNILYEDVAETSELAKKAAEKRAKEYLNMERELISVRKDCNLTLRDLREELEATRERNAKLAQDLVHCRRMRAQTSASYYEAITDLHEALDDIDRDAKLEEAEIYSMREEIAAARIDHSAAKTASGVDSMELSPTLLEPIPSELPSTRLELTPMPKSKSDSESDVSEIWDANAGSRRNSEQHHGSQERTEVDHHSIDKRQARRNKTKHQHLEHQYKDVSVTVNTTTAEEAERENKLHEMIRAPSVKEIQQAEAEDSWGASAWAALSASNMMGDVLLKIEEMTRVNAGGTATDAKRRTVPRNGRVPSGQRKTESNARRL
jgi:hypothetical protein